MKTSHMIFGYLLGIVYKINILWIWYYIPSATFIILAWELLSIAALVFLKLIKRQRITTVIKDPQTEGTYFV